MKKEIKALESSLHLRCQEIVGLQKQEQEEKYLKELKTRFKQLWHYQHPQSLSIESPKKGDKIPSTPQKI